MVITRAQIFMTAYFFSEITITSKYVLNLIHHEV